ncbi:hypothetical protein K502DRAFT_342235 [Neoconidiobolus thromboides FSU 785]|nr:hypothetical protein K502DRAFT_342235 [Neoconidiobolus thromboides FSU 785]
MNVFVLASEFNHYKRILKLNVNLVLGKQIDKSGFESEEEIQESNEEKVENNGEEKEYSLQYQFCNQKGEFKTNSYFLNSEVEFVSGSPKGYPFDEYKVPLSQNYDLIKNNQSQGLEFVLNYRAHSLPSLALLEIDLNGNKYLLLKRALTTKLLSVIVMICMWGISIFFMLYVLNQVRLKKAITPKSIAIGNTILFAFPKLRNTLPDIPPIGIYLDYFSFLWNMVLVSIVVIIQIILFVFKYKKIKG